MSLLQPLSRRRFLGTATLAAAGLRSVLTNPAACLAAETPYTPPASPRQTLDLNVDWRFLRADVPGAEAPNLDDAAWVPAGTPHSFNDVDSFRQFISHGGGDRGTYKGLAWYRKHFTAPVLQPGQRLILEVEGIRQAGEIYLNGKQVGLYENGVTGFGCDLTDAVRPGASNLLAIKVDNRTTYKERATETAFEWNSNDFNPDHGGITGRVFLHVLGPIHQTLPIYDGLQTQGVYIHADSFDFPEETVELTLESEVRNGSADRATVTLSAMVVDATGTVRAKLTGEPVDMVAGEQSVLNAAGTLRAARFWSVEDPALYDVYSVLEMDGKVIDVARTTTGFRKAEFRGGAGTGGVYLNGRFVYLKGYAQRSTNEWAGLGLAYPEWLHDYNAGLMRASHANYIRWMHVAPQRVDAEALARHGILQICPAGDKERDATGRQWEQRLQVMRATIIAFRNNPAILFWESGNTVVTAEHMQQMVALRKQWDPAGGRVMGTRGNSDDAANTAITPVAEFFGVMIGQAKETDALAGGMGGPDAIFRGYSAARRDRAPLIETEDFRDEGARRFWDTASPPYFGFHKGPNDTYEYTSESFALAGVRRYWEYAQNRISNPDKAHARWAGYASIYFSDSDADGRQDSSEVARVSGKVDAVRLPKQIYYAHRVMQNEAPDLHVIGHWSYPPSVGEGVAAKPVVKTIFVIANCESAELLVNGVSKGVNTKPESGFIFSFPAVAYAPGTLRAVGRNGTKVVAEHSLTTAGAAARIKLTPIVNRNGLAADGRDVALFDVEVVDVKGLRVPADDARIDFTLSGPAVWRGGYNSGKLDSTNNLWLNTECGINRVAVRSTLAAGTIALTARREGLQPARVEVVSHTIARS